MNEYLFQSKRLGFRLWKQQDLFSLTKMNQDPEVMACFPSILSEAESLEFIENMNTHYRERGYCYFAIDLSSEHEWIGFLGLKYQDFEADFTPCTDIGWRIEKRYWNRGLATEGASKCLMHAFGKLKLPRIVSMAPLINLPSIAVMKKCGMKWHKNFQHPKISASSGLKECSLNSIQNPYL